MALYDEVMNELTQKQIDAMPDYSRVQTAEGDPRIVGRFDEYGGKGAWSPIAAAEWGSGVPFGDDPSTQIPTGLGASGVPQFTDPVGYRGYGLGRASVVNPPSVSMEYHDPRRVHPTYPYPTTTESSVTPGQFIEAGGAPGGGGFSPQTYVPGTDPYSPDNPYGVDETALQYRGQVAGLTPEVRQSILNNATSEQKIENLIEIYGLPVVERVLREDIASGQFHEVGDTRSMSDDAATQQMLSNRRQGVIGNTDWMR